jgi:4'-phosphopantetheinyl transferase
MTEIYWLEQTEADLPAANDWLSESEAARLNSMRFEKRSKSWRLGRWTAKHAIVAYRNLPCDHPTLRQIEVRAAASGAPDVFIAHQPAPIAISLSHRDGTAVCAVAPGNVAVGCDIELIEPHSDAFAGDYFTAEEQELVARAHADDRSRLLALLWSGKESALKALREGLRLDTRSVVVNLDHPVRTEDGLEPFGDSNLATAQDWVPFHVRCTSGQVFHGWWRITEKFVRTLVAAPPPAPPITLSPSVPLAQSFG